MKILTCAGALILLLGLSPTSADAAGFDCSKAKSAIEKAICRDPALNKADDTLSELYRQTMRSFVIPIFIRDTQRMWLKSLPGCLKAGAKRDPDGASCLNVYEARIAALKNYRAAKVYTNYGEDFDHEAGTLIVYELDHALWLEWFGHWMPDANDPKPYPDGVLAHDSKKLVSRDGKLVLEQSEVAVRLTDEALVIEGDGLLLTPRQSRMQGEYWRVR